MYEHLLSFSSDIFVVITYFIVLLLFEKKIKKMIFKIFHVYMYVQITIG